MAMDWEIVEEAAAMARSVYAAENRISHSNSSRKVVPGQVSAFISRHRVLLLTVLLRDGRPLPARPTADHHVQQRYLVNRSTDYKRTKNKIKDVLLELPGPRRI